MDTAVVVHVVVFVAVVVVVVVAVVVASKGVSLKYKLTWDCTAHFSFDT